MLKNHDLDGVYYDWNVALLCHNSHTDTNATVKNDFCILSKPKVRGLKHAGILSQMAVIVVLLKRVACFIVKVTLALRKKTQNNKSSPVFFVPGPSVPKFILNLVMRE